MNSNFFPTGVAANLKISREASTSLDFIRAIAALLVMLSHLRSMFFVDFPQVVHPNPLTKAFYFISGLGHQAVIVFFVLSGLFISISIIKMISQQTWSWKSYLIQRLSRLWVVLIPSLLLTLFWDSLGIFAFNFKEIYSGSLASEQVMFGFPIVDRLDIGIFLGNVFFLQEIITTTYGSNGPMWSLAYEFWYYIAFPLALLAATSNKWQTKLSYIVALVGLGVFVGKSISLHFVIWLLGFAVLFMPKLWQSRKEVSGVWIALALMPFAACLALSTIKKSQLWPYPIAVFFTLILYLLLRRGEVQHTEKSAASENSGGNKSNAFAKLSNTMAGFSYSLYLLHVPPLLFLHAYLHSIQVPKWQPSPKTMLLGLGIAILITVYAWLISLFTEKKTNQFKALLQGTISRLIRTEI